MTSVRRSRRPGRMVVIPRAWLNGLAVGGSFALCCAFVLGRWTADQSEIELSYDSDPQSLEQAGSGAPEPAMASPAPPKDLDPFDMLQEVPGYAREAPAGRYGIQVGAFPSIDEAEAFLVEHQAGAWGLPLFLTEALISGESWHRVRVGAFKDRGDAERRREAQFEVFVPGAMVVRYR